MHSPAAGANRQDLMGSDSIDPVIDHAAIGSIESDTIDSVAKDAYIIRITIAAFKT